MHNVKLLEQTMALVDRSDLPVTKICDDLGFSKRWFYKLRAGGIDDPGVKRIQRLHDYLVEKAA
ncbi:MAG: hypothetical protein AB2761_20250 [Candidatus Thiodiazotropha endolucinida]